MKKIIHFDPTEAGQLHCDACHYDMPRKQAFTEGLIGMPCPVCSADMLTRADYDKTLRMFRHIDRINKWFGWMGSETPTAKAKSVSIRHHGNEVIIKTEAKKAA